MIAPIGQRCLMLAICAVSASTLGCAMCSNPHDCHYPAYGGIRPRVDDVHGRVGSLFNDASGQHMSYDESLPADAIIDSGGLMTTTDEMTAEPIPLERQFDMIEAPDNSSPQPPLELPEGADTQQPGFFENFARS